MYIVIKVVFLKKAKYFLFIYLLIILTSITANAAVFESIVSLKQYVDSEMEKRSSIISGNYKSDSEELKMYLNNLFSGMDYYKNSIYSYKYNYKGVENNVVFNIEIDHFMNYEEELYVNNRVAKIISEIIAENMNDHEKIKAVHDWIVLNSEYDTSSELRSPYDILSKGKSVCQGYALLFYLFMDKLNIPVKFITGETRSFNHIWNMVKADCYWYHIDLTFDDPVPDRTGNISYDF